MKGKRQVLVMITPLSRSRIDGILGFAERHDKFYERHGDTPYRWRKHQAVASSGGRQSLE